MLRLRDIMTTDVITLAPDMTLRAAMELFSAHQISGAPVKEGNRVIGVISATDIVAFATTPPEAQPTGADEPPGAEDWDDDGEWGDEAVRSSDYFSERWTEVASEADGAGGAPIEGDLLDRYTVSEAMTWGVYSLPPAADVVAAAEVMRTAGIHRMLVMEDGRLLGIVSTMDLVKAVARNRIVRRTFVFDTPRGGD